VIQETAFRLAPPRQVRIAGISLGVLAIKPEGDDPAAVLGVFDPDAGRPGPHLVRPGDELVVAGRTILVRDVASGPHGHVDVTVRWPEDPS
jgi:hypothetical protein